MLKIAAMLSAGMAATLYTDGWCTPTVCFASCLATLLLALASHRHEWLQSILLLLTCFLLGAFLMSRAEQRLQVSLPASPVEYRAVVSSEPVRRGKVVQCDLLMVGNDDPVKVRASILCDTIAKRFERLHVGSGIEAYSQLMPIGQGGASLQGYRRWLHSQGYQAQTFIFYSDWHEASVALTSLSMVQRSRLTLLLLRKRLLERLSSGDSEDNGLAVVEAMFLGDKSQLSKDLKNDYSIAGSSHILAISGLHLSILYGFLLFFFRRWRRSVPFLSLAILVVWAYVLLVGMPASAVRAAIMLTICTMVLMLHRRAVSLNTLSFAAILMLMVNPLNLFDVGFQLSFAAVFAILLWMPLAEPLFRWRTTAWWASSLRAVCGLLAVSLAAQLGTAPLVAYYFGRFSCYFLLTNLIAIPFAYLLLLMMVLTLLAIPIPALLSVFLSVTAYLANLLNTAMHAVAHLPGASIDHLHPSAVQVLLIYVLLLTFYFICKIVIRRMKVS